MTVIELHCPAAADTAMTATTFNPPAAAHDLEAAGIERRHAEAIAEGMRQAVSADRDELATRTDLAALEHRMTAMLYRALRIQTAALIGSQLAIAGFVVHLLSQ